MSAWQHLIHLLLAILFGLYLPCSGQGTTLTSSDAYLIYPEWTAQQQLLRFTFQTSALNGVLLYSEGSERSDYLLVRLVNGTMEVRLRLSGMVNKQSVGSFLNDNELHEFTIFHNYQVFQFRYRLDNNPIIRVSYARDVIPDIGSANVYIGGAPPTMIQGLETLLINASFIGCVEDVLVSNFSVLGVDVDSSSLLAWESIDSVGVVIDGCIDPCMGVNCGAGDCVSSWPDSAFCDCRGTGMLGESCTENPADNQLTFEPDSNITHYCYRILPEPYTSDFNSVSLQLVPPIPSEGTLIVAHPDGGRNSFSLRVEDSRVVFEYHTTDDAVQQLRLNTILELSNTVYQIDLSTRTNQAEVSLQIVNSNGVTSIVETLGTGTGETLYPSNTIFTTVCVGGSLLEYASYVGTIQSAFYGYNSLLEEQNFCRLRAEGLSKSDLIVFVENDIPRSLTFERFTLGSHNIAFQARTPREFPAGLLFVLENQEYHFSVAVFNGVAAVILQRVGGIEIENNFECREIVFNGEWHSFKLSLNNTLPDPFITVTINGVDCAVTGSSDLSREALPALAETPIMLGTTDNFFQDTIFSGCVSGIELQNKNTNEIFRPNLEAAPRLSDAFNVSACYHCAKMKQQTCVNGRVCTDCGVGLEATCECPEGLSGAMCDEVIQQGPATLTPNLTCPASLATIRARNVFVCPITSRFTTPPTITEFTTPPTTSSIETSDGNSTPVSTALSAQPPTANSRAPGVWIGVGVAIAVVLLLAIVTVFGLCVLYRRGASIRGFYQTNESASQDAPMIRYSASLRQLSSEVVSISQDPPSEPSWAHKNGDLSNGNPPDMQKPSFRTPGSGSKEFYL